MKRSVKFAIVTLAVSLFSIPMFAGTVASSNSSNVTAMVVGSCQINTPLTMSFGNYDPFSGTAKTATMTVTFKCVQKTNATDTYTIWFSKASSNMVNGTNNLAYTLTDSSSNPVSTTTPGTNTNVTGSSGVGATKGYSYVVNGSIAPGQDVPVGAYADTVVTNVNW